MSQDHHELIAAAASLFLGEKIGGKFDSRVKKSEWRSTLYERGTRDLCAHVIAVRFSLPIYNSSKNIIRIREHVHMIPIYNEK
uniref:Uncharacterized protein n=1 Tax=Oryza glaberrima TaxID=4538 RepID=I1QMN0_ORYGL